MDKEKIVEYSKLYVNVSVAYFRVKTSEKENLRDRISGLEKAIEIYEERVPEEIKSFSKDEIEKYKRECNEKKGELEVE